MKSIKAAIILFLSLTIAVPAFAGSTSDAGVGGIIGAIAGRALCRNCNQRTQNIATGAGLVAGGLAGYSYGSSNERRDNVRQQYADNDTRRSYQDDNRAVRTVDVSRASQATDWVEQPVQQQVTYVEPAMVRQAQALRPTRIVREAPIPRDGGCDEEYYHGSFNPEAAHAYCEGRRQREIQVRQAYAEGLAGR